MSTFLVFLLFALGLFCIIRGGDSFVDAAAWMASASGIPPFIIGATIVSVATTLPEILVSVMAALSGQADMAAGNAIGSVTANTALILALTI
ncbi:MAG: sodium:calcium antiporter, partial [Ruminococcus sp.]|nr:sodium:calcium antiporter [Ruminococcus sp.]